MALMRTSMTALLMTSVMALMMTSMTALMMMSMVALIDDHGEAEHLEGIEADGDRRKIGSVCVGGRGEWRRRREGGEV